MSVVKDVVDGAKDVAKSAGEAIGKAGKSAGKATEEVSKTAEKGAKVAAKHPGVFKKLGKLAKVGRGIPGLGTIIGLGFVASDIKHHRLGSLLMDGVACIPYVGTASVFADLGGDISGKLDKGFKKSGLTDTVYSAASRTLDPNSVKSDSKQFDNHRERLAEASKYDTLDSKDKSNLAFKQTLSDVGYLESGTKEQQRDSAKGLQKLNNNNSLEFPEGKQTEKSAERSVEKTMEL